MTVRRSLYRYGVLKPFFSQTKIISVGNISIGGSGKTPFTICLANLIKEMGYQAAVSHRGYKGELEKEMTLISNRQGLLPNATKSGDEPYLIASRLNNIPVIVGRNRKDAILKLEDEYPDLDFIILDDSFQHLKVKHHYDFVLIKDGSFAKNKFVFPAGPLREPLSALKGADCIINASSKADIAAVCSYANYSLPTIQGNYQVDRFYDCQGQTVNIDKLKKIALISAIGQPNSFEKTVTSCGLSFTKHYTYPDHYHFNDQEVLQKVIREKGKLYDYLLTTEKDFTKLQQYADLLPLVVVSISFVPTNPHKLRAIIDSLKNK